MSDDQTPKSNSRWLRPGRMEAFSDGVFAIAITLLVLDLAVPSLEEEDFVNSSTCVLARETCAPGAHHQGVGSRRKRHQPRFSL